MNSGCWWDLFRFLVRQKPHTLTYMYIQLLVCTSLTMQVVIKQHIQYWELCLHWVVVVTLPTSLLRVGEKSGTT